MRILIAEDDMTSRAMLQAVLARWGYDVTAASDGDQAWAALGEPDAPGLAVLDWEMPGPDGAELCRRLRAQEREKPLYLILLTSRSAPGDIVRGLEAGADDYIAKPYGNAELKARVDVGRRMLTLQNKMREREKRQGMMEGRAQISAAVLHHIGNAITPVKIYLGDMSEKDQNSPLEHLDKVYADLEEHLDDLQAYITRDERGSRVFRYMKGLIDAMTRQEEARRENTKRIEEAVSHITRILSVQHNYLDKGIGEKETEELMLLLEKDVPPSELAAQVMRLDK